MKLSIDKVRQLAGTKGLNLLACLSREQAELALSKQREQLKSWQAAGHAGEMKFMSREPEFYTAFDHILPETKTVLVFALSYASSFPHPPKQGYGRIARYAWGKDYHKILKKRLKLLMQSIEQSCPKEISWRAFTDAVPLLERSLFAETKLGFIGKNTMMIIPGVGSWTFIAEILVDQELSLDSESRGFPSLKILKDDQNCGSCQRCLEACPTQAFAEPFKLDARRCISYLTIEKPGSFSDWEDKALADWVFGCDICQEVCPFNHSEISKSKEQSFTPQNGSGPYLNLAKVLSIASDQEFLASFAGTPLMRAGRKQLLRNAAAVAGNQQDLASLPALEKLAGTASTMEEVQTSAERALQRFL